MQRRRAAGGAVSGGSLRNFDSLPPDRDHASLRYGTVIEGYGRALWARVKGAHDPAAWRQKVATDDATRAEDRHRTEVLREVLFTIETALAELRAAVAASETRGHRANDQEAACHARASELFGRVASANALAARNTSEVPELKIPLSEAAVADTITLLNLIHARYLLDTARETEVARQEGVLLFRLQRPVIVVGVLMLLTVLVALLVRVGGALLRMGGLPDPLFETQVPYVLVGLLLIVLIGYAGSVISVAQRSKEATSRPVLEGDPVSTIGGLASGWNGVLLAMASASLFAGIAYLLFASGIANLLGISGGLFPVPFGASECGGEAPDSVAYTATTFLDGPAVNRLAHVLGFCSGIDYMRMLVIAFVAGFSERLVPDMLQQIAARTGAGQVRGPKEVDPASFRAQPSAQVIRDRRGPATGVEMPEVPAPETRVAGTSGPGADTNPPKPPEPTE